MPETKLRSRQAVDSTSRRASEPGIARTLALVLASGGTLMLGGCKDSFMDPSVTGRWEDTPTIVPVLDRIATIEDDTDNTTNYSDPLPEDLLPQAFVYRLTAGDALEITLYDMIETNRPDTYQAVIDAKGMIDLPQIGRVDLAGKTVQQALETIRVAMSKFVADPLAQLNVINQRGDTYSIVGNVERSGTFIVPNSQYRLLEALTAGGRFSEDIEDIFVIRRIDLDTSDASFPAGASSGASPIGQPAPVQPTNEPAQPSKSGEDLLKIIDEVTGPGAKPAGSPGMMNPAFSANAHSVAVSIAQPENPPAPPIDLPDSDTPVQPVAEPARPVTSPAVPDATNAPAVAPTETAAELAPAKPAAQAPAIELADTSIPPAPPTPTSLVAADQPAAAGSRWVFLNGKWTQVVTQSNTASGVATVTPVNAIQRVIRIPTRELLAGKHQYNIVIRPGDVIRVPSQPTGLVYLSGQIARPGPITLPPNGGLTLLRALDAGGGLSNLAIPERIDLTRMIGRDRQATIRLDGRAIAEATQPDVYLKANDRINVGTNFWALPLAVIRNGFRASYGFGFLVDRNFGNDIFGPPPDATRTFQ